MRTDGVRADTAQRPARARRSSSTLRPDDRGTRPLRDRGILYVARNVRCVPRKQDLRLTPWCEDRRAHRTLFSDRPRSGRLQAERLPSEHLPFESPSERRPFDSQPSARRPELPRRLRAWLLRRAMSGFRI